MTIIQKVSNFVLDISNDDVQLEKLIDDQMIALIKEEHPRDYHEYLTSHEKQLNALRQRIKARYKKEVQPRISQIFSLAHR